MAWSLIPSEFTAVLIGPSPCCCLISGSIHSQLLSIIVIWSNPSIICLFFDFEKILSEVLGLNGFLHYIAQTCSIAILNALDKNVGNIESKVTVVHGWISAHRGHHFGDFILFTGLECLSNCILNNLNCFWTDWITSNCRVINLVVELPKVFLWINNSRG